LDDITDPRDNLRRYLRRSNPLPLLEVLLAHDDRVSPSDNIMVPRPPPTAAAAAAIAASSSSPKEAASCWKKLRANELRDIIVIGQ
jgi:hypothetical protein